MTEGEGLQFDLRTNVVDVARRMGVARQRLESVPPEQLHEHADEVIAAFAQELHALAQLDAGEAFDLDAPAAPVRMQIHVEPDDGATIEAMQRGLREAFEREFGGPLT